MRVNQLFEMQAQLDQHIVEQHQLQKENLFDRKVVALLVEIGELANETRSFKYWSLKPPASNEIILEEFVDGIHFILSIGIELGFKEEDMMVIDNEEKSIVDQFLTIYQQIADLRQHRSKEAYLQLFSNYLLLGVLLGFSEDQIIHAYISKNEVNYKRQEQGY